MKRIALTLIVAGAIVLLRMTVLAPKPIAVRIATVERGRVEETVTNSKAGTIKSRMRARISAETGGRVTAILHREGEVVEAGDALILLDDATSKAQVELAKATIEASHALRVQACLTRDHAGRELARNRKLAQQKVVSVDLLDSLQVAFDTAKAACEAARADENKAQATLSNAEAELEKRTVRAPFSGVVAEVTTELGEWVTPSPPMLVAPPVVDLINLKTLYVSAPMDEVDSARIQLGQATKVTVDSRKGQVFKGSVVRVAPYVLDVEAQNRTVEVEVGFDPPDQGDGLLPGTSADVEIILDARDNVLRVPTSSIFEENHVLLERNGRLEKRKLEVGLHNWDFTEVRSGLEAGDRVVLSIDRKEVTPGAHVEVIEGDEASRDSP